jgi:hypothetical protein
VNMKYATKLTQTMATSMDGHSGQGPNAYTEIKRRSFPLSVLRFPNKRRRLLTKTSNSDSNAIILVAALLPPRSVHIISSCREPRDLPLAAGALDRKDRHSFSQANDSAWVAKEFLPSLDATSEALAFVDRATPSDQGPRQLSEIDLSHIVIQATPRRHSDVLQSGGGHS